jgi:hypothetical protein
VQEEVIYRCINPACARPMPRPVNFCPWCGTAQGRAAPRAEEQAGAAADTTMHAPAPAPGRRVELGAAAGAATAAANANAAPDMSRQAVAMPPRQDDADAPRTTTGKGHAPPSATDFGRSAAQGRGASPGAGSETGAMGAAPAPARQEVPRPPIPARPPQRKPVQLRWWILALAILWAVWLLAKPSGKKIERQIEHASALARECKGGEAQDELIALRSSRATPEQLERLQNTLNEQSAICTKRRLRNKAWLEASSAADVALDAGSAERARTRLQGFIRRWGEDDKTRALKARIDAAAEREKHPLAVPPGQAESGTMRDDANA